MATKQQQTIGIGSIVLFKKDTGSGLGVETNAHLKVTSIGNASSRLSYNVLILDGKFNNHNGFVYADEVELCTAKIKSIIPISGLYKQQADSRKQLQQIQEAIRMCKREHLDPSNNEIANYTLTLIRYKK